MPQGYLVIDGFLHTDTVQSLKDRIQVILNEYDVFESKSIFTTKEQERDTDDYFLTSGDKIRFFWEADAWLDDKQSLKQAPELSINKIGHALHDLDPYFYQVSYDNRIGSICRSLGMSVPIVVQSMYIFKQPKIGGEVGAHQDGAFLYTEPQRFILCSVSLILAIFHFKS